MLFNFWYEQSTNQPEENQKLYNFRISEKCITNNNYCYLQ